MTATELVMSHRSMAQTSAMTDTAKSIPSVNWLTASRVLGDCERYFNVTSFSPSLIIRCTMMSALKAMVHVESRSRFSSVRKTSARPASPECVASRMCSTYLALGGASCRRICVSDYTIRPFLLQAYLDLCSALDRLLERARHLAGGPRRAGCALTR